MPTETQEGKDMGSVIRMEEHRDAPPGEKGAARLPRRVTEPGDRAPIVVDTGSREPGTAFTVEGVPEQAAVLRRRLASAASLPPRATQLVQELANELFGNAVRHSRSGQPGGEVTVALHRLHGRVQVRVTDQGPRDREGSTPHVRPWDLLREGGLGLRLVAAQAHRWGTLHEPGGTTVWFEVDRPRAR